MAKKLLVIKENIYLGNLVDKVSMGNPVKVSINNSFALLRYIGESGAEVLLRAGRSKRPMIGYVLLENYRVVNTSVMIDGLNLRNKQSLLLEKYMKDAGIN